MDTVPESETITLTWHEAAMASHVGWIRHLASIRAGHASAAGFSGYGWSEHCEGACAECAVAKWLGCYWSGSVGLFKNGTDLPGIEVRMRRMEHYELIVRDDDDDRSRYVLATGRCPTYRVRGWILGADAKRPEWSQTHGGRPAAYFVPTAALRPMAELKGGA